MRGVIRGDESNQSFYIIGYLNWYILLFVAYVLMATIMGTGPTFAPLLILVAIMGGIQFYRFNNISEVAFEWLKNNK